jgi:inosine-uridine nucleoside N-ribohydrolase
VNSPDPIKVLIDTDTGIDDAMAVVYALLDPRLELVGLTSVFGNVDVEQTTRNTLALLEALDRVDVPLAMGAAKGLIGSPTFSPHVHGVNGVGDAEFAEPQITPVSEHAAEFIVRLAREQPGELTLVPVGPLTNLALALALEPKLPQLIKRVVWMGGVAVGPGNVTPVAEADAWHDPEAAEAVFEAGWPITMVGLDVTDVTLLHGADLERIGRADTPAARYVAAITPFYIDFYEKVLGFRACAMHSALTVAVVAQPSLITDSLHAPVRVELSGSLTRGMTVADRRTGRDSGADREWLAGNLVEIPIAVDSAAFIKLFLELVCADER